MLPVSQRAFPGAESRTRWQRFCDVAASVVTWAGIACVAAIVVLCIVTPPGDVPTWLEVTLVLGALLSRPLWGLFVILGA